MKKTKTKEDKALDGFFNDYIAEQKANGASAQELAANGEALIKQFMKRFYESALQGEMEHHLGYKKGDIPTSTDGNRRNGSSKKTVISNSGEIEIEIPRDRSSEFDPAIIPKNERRLSGFNEKVLYLYAQGLSQREIAAQLKDLYHTDVSQELISKVTDSINDDVLEWRNRPLDNVYPIIYLDALVVKVKQDGSVSNHAVYVALGVDLRGQKEVLGLWISQNEGAKFWLRVLTELKNRGLNDILIACIDGLSGFNEAITNVYPQTQVQSCIVHAVRNSLKFVSWRERKAIAADLKKIYQSPTRESGEAELAKFREKWDESHPIIGDQWERNWEKLSLLYAYPEDIRKAIYTTNAIESLNHSLRRVLKHKKSFPSEESLMKMLYLCINRVSEKWTMPIKNWGPALARFKIEFGKRLPDISKIDI